MLRHVIALLLCAFCICILYLCLYINCIYPSQMTALLCFLFFKKRSLLVWAIKVRRRYVIGYFCFYLRVIMWGTRWETGSNMHQHWFYIGYMQIWEEMYAFKSIYKCRETGISDAKVIPNMMQSVQINNCIIWLHIVVLQNGFIVDIVNIHFIKNAFNINWYTLN